MQRLIHSGETLVVPDAYDAISARIIEHAGFKAVQCSGFSISVSKAYDDERFVTLDENLSRTMEIASAVRLPVMADGEDGYGQGDIFRKNIERFLNTGIAGINIEDQNLWDHYHRERITPIEIMIDKIESVLSMKKEMNIPDFLLNARTDSLKAADDRKEALKSAIDRANRYLHAGADMVFVTNVKTRDEVRLLKKEINGPLSIAAGLQYNISEFSVKDCCEIGIARVSLPAILILASLKALLTTAKEIFQTQKFDGIIRGEYLIDKTALADLLKEKG